MNKLWMLIVVGIPLIIIAMIIGTIRAERKRKEELHALAERLGMSFADKDDAALAPLKKATNLFERGASRRISNIMHGHIADLTAYIFDYTFTTGSGDSRVTHYQTMAAFFAEQSRAPKFELRPERVTHRIASYLGYDDIDLPDHAEFSKKYHLKGEEEALVRSAFTSDVAGRLLQGDKVCIESSGQWMVIYRPGRRLKPHQIEAYLNEAFELCTLFV